MGLDGLAVRNACPIGLRWSRWSNAGNSLLGPGLVPSISFTFELIPAVDRRSDTDSRPMLEPRDGLGETVFGFTGTGPVPGAAILRCGMEEEVEEERDGGREFRSGDIFD